ncbi:hypothetical protein MSG28_001016 [Choristoneura fumiferana]|uniref:Uncharacterized protein n=1 Tax=Choristoneura fumiferana TaxID=7141 RepID=A0ACC0K3D6_CHOFU|nr:hypothetical protein MSG28_001016 [Choristoneura fumiferana]
MHRWAILWQASTLLLVGGTLDFGYFARLRPDMLNSQGGVFLGKPAVYIEHLPLPRSKVDHF